MKSSLNLLVIILLSGVPCASSGARSQETPKPIPQIGEQPELMWSVVPEQVVEDTFGKKVMRELYAIEVIVENSTGKDFSVSFLGFQRPGEKQSSFVVPIASLDLVMLLSKGQQTISLHKFAFKETLVVRNNAQRKTIVFVLRKALEIGDQRTASNPREVMKRLGGLVAEFEALGEPKRLVVASVSG